MKILRSLSLLRHLHLYPHLQPVSTAVMLHHRLRQISHICLLHLHPRFTLHRHLRLFITVATLCGHILHPEQCLRNEFKNLSTLADLYLQSSKIDGLSVRLKLKFELWKRRGDWSSLNVKLIMSLSSGGNLDVKLFALKRIERVGWPLFDRLINGIDILIAGDTARRPDPKILAAMMATLT
jgi:hypothetical protein